MTIEYNAFPIVGRRTSEFPSATVNVDAQLIYWNGVAGDNLKRTGLQAFMNHASKYLTSAPETLAANKEVGPSDTFMQILISGASPRVITVLDGLSCFVHNSTTSANTLTVEGTALLAGESAFVLWNGTTAHTVVKMAASGSSGTTFLTITLTDITDATYYYYGGVDAYAAWQINRYLKSNLATRTGADVILNSGHASLAAAWAARTTLTYA